MLPRPGAVPPQRDHRRRAEHLRRPAGVPRAARRRPVTVGLLAIPGTAIDVTPRGDRPSPTRPPTTTCAAIFERQGRRTSRATRPTGCRGSTSCKATWDGVGRSDLVADAAGVVGAAARHGADAARARGRCGRACCDAGDVEILDRLPRRRGARLRRRALRVPLRHRPRRSSRRSSPSAPSTGATRCSCRAASGRGARASSTSTSTTSSSHCRASGCDAPRPRRSASCDPPTETEPDIELGDWVVQRRCPHRNADLAVFGEVDGGELTCTLHGWRFDLETGRCLTAGQPLVAGAPPGRLTAGQVRAVGAVHPHRDADRQQVGGPR